MKKDKDIKPFFILGAGGEEEEPRTPVEAPEGIINQTIPGEHYPNETPVNANRVVTLAQIRTNDILCEGPIEGLVSGEYDYIGELGNIGWTKANFIPYQSKILNGREVNWLRSIYWNETPVLDRDNLLNFQQVDVGFTNGSPNGSTIDGALEELTKTRGINERLRGPSSSLTNAGSEVLTGEVEQNAKTYRILNKHAKAAIIHVRIPTLSRSVLAGKKAGDIVQTSLEYRIFYKPVFFSVTSKNVLSSANVAFNYKFVKKEIVEGKTNYGYIRSSRIEFEEDYTNNEDFIGWEIKIFRVTPDSFRGSLRNQTWVDALTEIYGEKFNYPNSALVSSKFNAEYFNQIPARGFDTKLLKVKIPSNYDPILKKYNGIWDGSFKTDENGNEARYWTDNPAWCFYDILTTKRYGLGKFINKDLVDKWTLYEIARYCDQLVPDGYGGLEPRFTCNLMINSRNEAYRVINDMASIFRGLTYYAAGAIYTAQDSLKSSVMQFTNANVENGDFSYSSSSKKTRATIALVRYNDKNDLYKPAVEYIEDTEGIKKFGIRELELTAFGTTSRGQAIRLGRWALLTNRLETESISFQAGLEASYLRPGDVIRISDNNRQAVRYAGRTDEIKLGEYQEITLDNEISLSNAVYQLSLLTPTYNYPVSGTDDLTSSDISNIRRSHIQTIPISGNSIFTVNNKTKITLTGQKFDFDAYQKVDYMVWMIEASGGQGEVLGENIFEEYRILNISENEDYKYAINAVSYSTTKFTEIESGIKFELQDINIPTPTNLNSISLDNVTLPNSTVEGIEYTISYPNGEDTNVRGAYIYAKRGNWVSEDFTEAFAGGPSAVTERPPNSKYLIQVLPYGTYIGQYVPISAGTYHFRAYSRNSQGVHSAQPAEGSILIDSINDFQGYKIRSLRHDSDTDENPTAGSRDSEILNLSETSPTFTWDAGFETDPEEQFSNLIPNTDISFRITARKSTSAFALNPATGNPDDEILAGGSEIYENGNQFKPSNVIYYELTNFQPDNADSPEFVFTFDEQLEAYKTLAQGLNVSGIYREYDLVVEAHLADGTSSAGGNFNNVVTEDSSFTNPNGWDIMRVYNPPIRKILSEEITDAYYTSDGNIKVELDNIVYQNIQASGVQGGYIFVADGTPDYFELVAGSFYNVSPIQQLEFKTIQNPFSINSSEILNMANPSIAIAFYDEADEAIRTQAKENDPYFDIVDPVNDPDQGFGGAIGHQWNKYISTLQVSDPIPILFRSASSEDRSIKAIIEVEIRWSQGNRTVNWIDGQANYQGLGYFIDYMKYKAQGLTTVPTEEPIEFVGWTDVYSRNMVINHNLIGGVKFRRDAGFIFDNVSATPEQGVKRLERGEYYTMLIGFRLDTNLISTPNFTYNPSNVLHIESSHKTFGPDVQDNDDLSTWPIYIPTESIEYTQLGPGSDYEVNIQGALDRGNGWIEFPYENDYSTFVYHMIAEKTPTETVPAVAVDWYTTKLQFKVIEHPTTQVINLNAGNNFGF